ncbi:uncharacterized protein LOC141898890 [Tubulanus polymorphus]|uniref:uncharacterized protein LOC141898890 n=1 Tax=Tubulanus polymorphus TaxID=672921 RepID=UPI003DA50981
MAAAAVEPPSSEQHAERPLTPPPSYESIMQERPSLAYVDFWPSLINPDETKIKRMKFEKFDVLIERANEFLSRREDIVIKNVESVEKKVGSLNDIQNGTMFYRATECSIYVHGLRIWYLKQGTAARTRPQQVKYVNLIPRRLNPGEKYPEFESIYQTVTTFNEQLYSNPRGHIVGISTVFVKVDKESWKMHDGNMDWDTCSWMDVHERHAFYFLRVFHLEGATVHEAIGVEDITPTCLEDRRIHDHDDDFYDDFDDLWNSRRYTQFSTLVQEAHDWISTNGKVKIQPHPVASLWPSKTRPSTNAAQNTIYADLYKINVKPWDSLKN